MIPSSEITYELDPEDNNLVVLKQNYQIMTQSRRVAKINEIQEFQITWRNTKDNPSPVYTDIKLIGKKLFMNH